MCTHRQSIKGETRTTSLRESEYCGELAATARGGKTRVVHVGLGRGPVQWPPMGMVKNLISMSLCPLCDVTISDDTSKLCVLIRTAAFSGFA